MMKKLYLYFFLSALLISAIFISPAVSAKQGDKDQKPLKNTESRNNEIKTNPSKEKKTDTRKDALQTETDITGKNGNNEDKQGKDKLKDLISRAATDPAGLKNLNKKLLKLEIKNATPSSFLKKRHAVMGIISSISGNIITLNNQIKTEKNYTITTDGNTVITGKSPTGPGGTNTGLERGKDASSASGLTLVTGMRIAVFGKPQPDGTLLADRIHIIPGKAIGVYNKPDSASSSAVKSAKPSEQPDENSDNESSPSPTSAIPSVQSSETPTVMPTEEPSPTRTPPSPTTG